MNTQPPLMPYIPEQERTPLTDLLIQTIEWQQQKINALAEKSQKFFQEIDELKEEVRRLKGLQSKPTISPSKMNDDEKSSQEKGKRPGSKKRKK
jgi:DNA-binding protein H-NS